MTNSTNSPMGSAGPTISNDARAMMLFDANKKSALIAYLFWFFLGGFGAHRFYGGKTGSGIVQLVMLVLGFVLLAAGGLGLLVLGALGIWVLVDAFLIPGWIRSQNTMLAQSLS